jgi:hypothetical protein
LLTYDLPSTSLPLIINVSAPVRSSEPGTAGSNKHNQSVIWEPSKDQHCLHHNGQWLGAGAPCADQQRYADRLVAVRAFNQNGE